jgi:hypothetical protein
MSRKPSPPSFFWFGHLFPAQPMYFMFAFLLIPPVTTYHCTDLITQGFSDVKTSHGKCGYRLSYGFD